MSRKERPILDSMIARAEEPTHSLRTAIDDADAQLTEELESQTRIINIAYAAAKDLEEFDDFEHGGVVAPLLAVSIDHARFGVGDRNGCGKCGSIHLLRAHAPNDTRMLCGSCGHEWNEEPKDLVQTEKRRGAKRRLDPNVRYYDEIAAFFAWQEACAERRDGQIERFRKKIELGGDVVASTTNRERVADPYIDAIGDAIGDVRKSLGIPDWNLFEATYYQLKGEHESAIAMANAVKGGVGGLPSGSSLRAGPHVTPAMLVAEAASLLRSEDDIRREALVDYATREVEIDTDSLDALVEREHDRVVRDVASRVSKVRRALRVALQGIEIDDPNAPSRDDRTLAAEADVRPDDGRNALRRRARELIALYEESKAPRPPRYVISAPSRRELDARAREGAAVVIACCAGAPIVDGVRAACGSVDVAGPDGDGHPSASWPTCSSCGRRRHREGGLNR